MPGFDGVFPNTNFIEYSGFLREISSRKVYIIKTAIQKNLMSSCLLSFFEAIYWSGLESLCQHCLGFLPIAAIKSQQFPSEV